MTITTLTSVISTVKDKIKEARDAAIEAGDAAASLSDEIIDLTGQYIDLCEAVKTDTSAKEDLLKTQDNLLEKLGIEKNRVQELVQEYGNLTDAIKAASLEKLTQVERDLRGGLSAKKEALFDAAKANGIAKYSMNHIITSWNKQNADVNRKALQALVDKGMISAGSYGSLGMELWLPTDGRFDPTTIEGIINSYERLGAMMDALRKDTEDLIDATEQLNSDNIDATETIEDLGYQILETKNDIVSYIEEIYKEQTEAYRKIIDQRKELIQSAKDEYDYESDVADKVKEIADLQARIDQLSLDDSRSALAERRALEEELAKLQSDLSKTQEDHSTNAQLDALDKMADDYEQTVEEDIEKLKQTVNSTSDVWNAFYNTILGNNVSVGDSIDAEIVDAWLRAAQAVQTYGAAVNSISGVSTTVADLPKYHDGGIVSGSNLGNDELLAVLQEGEIVFTHAQLVGMIENARNGIQGALESIVQSLVDSIPAVSNVMNSIANDNSKTDNSSEVISPHVEINFTHSGFMSEADLKKYGKIIGDMTIERIIEPFRRDGLMNTRKSRLRPG